MAEVGDATYLSNYLVNTRVYGVVVPPGDPPEFWATMEIRGDQGTLFMAAVIGPDGQPGRDAFALKLQTDDVDSPDHLPRTMTDTPADIGKYWVIDDVNEHGDVVGTSLYVWYGTSWRRLMLGTPGPPGPVPIITPTVEVVDAATHSSSVDVGGTPRYPTWHMKLACPEGPQGPAAALWQAPDVDLLTSKPVPGDVLGYIGQQKNKLPVWQPVSISQLIPSPYSMPEAAFVAFSGVSARAAIGSFVLPPQPFPWTPVVWGHLGVRGFELSNTPLTIGCQVLLGAPETGQLIARGFGNSTGEVSMWPHYSTPDDPTRAVSPTNSLAVVPANHVDPAQGTLYVNLYNDGNIGAFKFNPTDAQLFILVVPVPNTTGPLR